jgi:hypothetical protein
MNSNDLIATITAQFVGVFQQLAAINNPIVKVEFYPYTNARSTIRQRKGVFEVRIADILHDAPAGFFQALAVILVARLFDYLVPASALGIFNQYLQSTPIVAQIAALRQQRGKKRLSHPLGNAYDLGKLFHKLNNQYFANALPLPQLGWSLRSARYLLACYDPTHNVIVVNPRLDCDTTPAYVVEFVLYHEMLHLKYCSSPANIMIQRQCWHPVEFRQEEQRFREYHSAKNWLQAFQRAYLSTVNSLATRQKKT